MATPPPGSLIYNGILNPTEEERGFAPLPQLNTAGQATYAQPKQSPIDVFNMKLMELLGKAQGANSGNPELAARASELQIGQTERSMAPASELGIEGLRPGDALNARQNESQLYNPEVRALNDRMQLNNEAVSRFENTIKAAKEWGEEYYKSVKPDDMTIEAVRMQMKAGIKPSEAILEKVRTSLTQADWDSLAAAGGGDGKTTDIKEYELAKSEGYSGSFQQWQDRGGSGGGSGATMTERLIAEREGIAAKIKGLPRGENGFANPNDYLDQASSYVSKNGNINDLFAVVPPERYLSSSDAAYVRKLLSGSGRSV